MQIVAGMGAKAPDVEKVIFNTEQDDGVSVQVVQCRDGQWAILYGGQLMTNRRWHPGEVENCIRAYLRILRQQAPA